MAVYGVYINNCCCLCVLQCDPNMAGCCLCVLQCDPNMAVYGVYINNCCCLCVLQCDPNMAVYGVYINNLDIRLPRIALFAVRDIEKGAELTFDYKMTGESQLFPTGGEW